MSLLRAESLRVVAQSLGIEELSDACVRELLPEVELRVRQVVQDALKFQRHSKKPQLATTHVNQALQARRVEVCSLLRYREEKWDPTDQGYCVCG
jgi:transcription initiation factor TFIID subunit 6